MRVFSAFFILASLLVNSVTAFPSGAGSCSPGTQAILTPNLAHAVNAQVDGAGDSLAFFGLELSIDGEALDPATPKDVFTGEPHGIAITATGGDAFRGFLMRLDGTVDTRAALAPRDADDAVRVAVETCINVESVGGLTHNNPSREDVTSAIGVLQLEEPEEGMVLDVTVVVRNSVMQDISQWYFSSYTLNAVTPPTSPPASMPMATEMPTPADGGTSAASRFSRMVVVGTAVVAMLSALVSYNM